MEIYIPTEHKYGEQVYKFLKSVLTREQQVQTFERIEFYTQYSLLDLIRIHKITKIEGSLYELRVPIAKVQLRFFGVVKDGDNLYIIHSFKKKSQRLPIREIKTAKNKRDVFESEYFN